MLERSFLLYLLVQDGLQRFSEGMPQLAQKINLQSRCMDSMNYLQSLKPTDKPDVIYLDPMFPRRSKAAKIKKEMQILQDFLEAPEDPLPLFNTACRKAGKRVVVKRPLHEEYLSEKSPDITYRGKSTRFDIYLLRSP